MGGTETQNLHAEIERLKQQLADSQKTHEEFVAASYDGYWDWHLRDDYEYMSPRFWDILGFDPKTKKHHPSEWQKLIFPEDLEIALQNLDKHIATKGAHPYAQEVRYRHQNSSTVTVLCRGKVVEWDENDQPLRMIGTHTDISHLKKQEKQIQTQKMDLERMNQELMQFNYAASHDLQAPLRHIASFIEALEESLGPKLTDEEKEYMKLIHDAAIKMKLLIQDLLEFAKISATPPKIDKVDLKAFLESLEEVYSCQGVKFSHSTIPVIQADQALIEKLLKLLIENAYKYRNENKTLEISLTSQEDNQHWIISVADNGIGFKDDDKERIFFVFHRLKIKQGVTGTGIGLAICKKIVECHGGSIWASARPGDGAVFSFSIPKIDNKD